MLGPFQIAISRLALPLPTEPLTAQTPRGSFPVTFEEVFDALESWPRMFIEPDGSFVWIGKERDSQDTVSGWQLDGHLYDRDNRLLFIELQGVCPKAALEQVIDILAVPRAELCVEQRRAGVYQVAAEFLSTF